MRIGADVTGVTAGLNTLDKRTRRLKKQFGSVTDSTLRWRSALGVLAGATGVAFAAKKIFDLGASVEETASKFNTVFGPSVESSQRFLDEFANTAGLTITQGRELLATTGAIAQGMGFSQAASAAFAEQITRLSGDLSSFNNIPIAETSRAIQSALTGERESLKRLGIVILETDVQQRALEMTGKATAKALTQQEKATATLALITERAGVAVGDLARTMDSPANRARKLVAEIFTLRDSLAHALLPTMGVVLTELGEIGGADGFTGLGDKITESSGIIAAWAKFAVETFKTVALAIAAPVRIAFNLGEILGKQLTAMIQLMKGDFAGARDTIVSVVGDFGDMKTAITNVITGFDNMRVASGLALETMKKDLEPTISNDVTPAVEIAKVAFRDMASEMVIAINPTITLATGLRVVGSAAGRAADEVNRLAAAQSRLSAASGILGALGRIPGLGLLAGAAGPLGIATGLVSGFRGLKGRAHGGPVSSGSPYVVGERGPELFVPGQSGTVVPGGGDTVVNIQLVAAGGGRVIDNVTVRQRRNDALGRVVRVPVPVGMVS